MIPHCILKLFLHVFKKSKTSLLQSKRFLESTLFTRRRVYVLSILTCGFCNSAILLVSLSWYFQRLVLTFFLQQMYVFKQHF